MCVATWFAHKLAGHLLQRGRQFFVLRSSALRGGPNVFSFFGRPCTNSGTAFCRIVSAFSRHSAAGTCIDPDTVCVAVVSLWLSGDIDGSAWLRRLRGNPRALGGPAGAEGSRPRAGNLRTRLRSLRGIQLLVHAADTI